MRNFEGNTTVGDERVTFIVSTTISKSTGDAVL